MEQTLKQYDEVLSNCRSLYQKKMQDYGTSWRIMRLESLTDQLFIKASRIRTIEENENQKVQDSVVSEFIGLVNYSLMALIQKQISKDSPIELEHVEALQLFDTVANEVRALMIQKNHDYGEAWRSMRVSSLTDLILMKLHRIKQIEDNDGSVKVSEGVEGSYSDIVNYALFALIKLTL